MSGRLAKASPSPASPSPVPWGERLGEGGEGTVYAYGAGECVKVYKDVEDPERLERKLRALVAARTDRLEQAAAWPREIVFAATDIQQGAASQTPSPQPPPGTNIRQGEGEPVGFTMQRVPDARPVHQVYQARSRQRFFPKADWAFLVRVARNLATCVHFVHEEGLVIGDLNESNVLVSQNGTVRLIDADSFQIERDGFLQTCDVGKGELLAPELQGRSLAGLRRTEQHDLFALAVLIFHLLVVGRHPFAGRPLQPKAGEADVSLEDAIRRGWYAYSDPPAGPLFPPPGLELSWLPVGIREMFLSAFLMREGAGRPTAQAWFSALEQMESSLERCAENDRHVFPAANLDVLFVEKDVPFGKRDVTSENPGVPSEGSDVISGKNDGKSLKSDVTFQTGEGDSSTGRCPWCVLEEAWSTYLFIPERHRNSELSKTDIAAIELQLQSIALAEPMFVWLEKGDEVESNTVSVLYSIFIGVQMLRGVFNAFEKGNWAIATLFLVLIIVGFAALNWKSLLRARLLKARQRAHERLRDLPDRGPFDLAREAGLAIAARYKEGDTRLESYRLDILRYRYGNALLHHLGKYSILAADVPSVGFARLEALHRMGILTAADLKRENFEQGMWSPPHVDELMTWRNAIELQFWATSSYTLSDAEEEDVRNKVASEQAQIEKQLKAAPKELEKLRDDIEERRRRLIDEFHRELQPLRKSRLFRGAFKNLNGYDLPDMSGERTR